MNTIENINQEIFFNSRHLIRTEILMSVKDVIWEQVVNDLNFKIRTHTTEKEFLDNMVN